MSKITEFAKGIVGGSKLMQGRKKLSTDEVLGVALTMRDFELLNSADGGTFPVIIFDEIADGYYCGGKVLSDICNGIENGGMHADLIADGLRIILDRKLTRDHKTCVTVAILD